MEFSDVIRKRRSVRAFAAAKPPFDEIERIIDIARRAPSAGFSQGIDFLVLDDPETVERFWTLNRGPYSDGRPERQRAPVVILVLSDPKRYLERYSADDKIAFGLDDLDRWPVRFWDVDGGMASMQLQLAAVDAGLATWFLGISVGEEQIRRDLSIPDDRMMVGVIAIGYRDTAETPDGSGASRARRPLEDQIHHNGW